MAKSITALIKNFSKSVDKMSFSDPVKYVYNPLDYTWPLHEQFVQKYGTNKKRILFLGMNPGPYGMAQTGVPFGEVNIVKDWLKIKGEVNKPKKEHPKRPIQGLDCPRSEVSGQRLWGYFKEKFKKPEKFFKDHYVINYCPLVFMESSGKNITPDKLKVTKKKQLFKLCDDHLKELIDYYQPEYLIGVGKFAQERAKEILKEKEHNIKIECILHPSPASPIANRGWAEQADKQLQNMGIW